ncbi:hypothetical protein N7532_001336 [Penicillium argentinense]|uniref:Uncharacterized protein n=1 Tax=Penicillium argentinense TaxID=1131581 RepID=A0A9W9G298_9EURO|nr:uncharacterized protein N7532_001336 [Penicillium argentinense]KAJ5110801.1 hypothetical protein N7532_001336 [Penicillium argentinense]
MSAFNPFRSRNLSLARVNPLLPIRRGPNIRAIEASPRNIVLMRSYETGGSTQGNAAMTQPPINLPPDLFTKPVHPLPSQLPSQLPNDYPRKSALSLEIEDNESSSDDQAADPFNPDSSVSDNDEDNDESESDRGHPRSFASRDDHPRGNFGSAPHPAPSDDGSTTTATSFSKTSATNVPVTEKGSPDTAREFPSSSGRSTGHKSSENDDSRNPANRANREKKPPPPPRSHHGKRIKPPASSSQSQSSRSTKRSSFHASSPESVTSVQPSGTRNANVTASHAPASDYVLSLAESQQAMSSTDSLQRSSSQNKQPPTPPLSRRHSQMRRSKSTQSKSSGSRLTMSSHDSESNDSSQPPSPGSLTRFPAAANKRVSMPPPSSGEIRAPVPATGTSTDAPMPPSSSRPTPPPPGRRASSHGSPATGSSSGAPPPPPPRRARDSTIRSSDSGESQMNRVEAPLPKPSNAHDILADLSRLQKEVDDLRGHYENRKVSQ